MLDLLGLQASETGRDFLRSEGVFDDAELFQQSLLPPAQSLAAGEMQPPETYSVYTHQQSYFDYRGSVIAKVTALRDLAGQEPRIRPMFLWIDSDRAASDKLGIRLYWPAPQGHQAIRFAPAKCEQREARLITQDPSRLAEATQTLERLVHQSKLSPGVIERFESMRPYLATGKTLVSQTRLLTDFLFEQTLSFQPEPLLVSTMLCHGQLTTCLEQILNQREHFISVFNRRVQELHGLNISTAVAPLADDYLPLFFSCPRRGTRLRLKHQKRGKTHFAVAHRRGGGEEYRFALGHSKLTLDELKRQGQWSPDVTLPILVNPYFSGMVVGRSSALYMLVFRAVIAEVLGPKAYPDLLSTKV